MPPRRFRTYSHFVLWEAVSQTKYCYSPKIKYFAPKKILGWLRYWCAPTQSCIYILPTQSAQSVKMVANLLKWSHNQLSPLLCTKVKHSNVSPSLTQWFVSWSITVVSKALFETQTRVAKGQKMGRTEATQIVVVCFQRYQCLSVSSCL